MDSLGELILSIYGVLLGVAIILIIFLIIRRIKIKKSEDFEKRNN